MKKQKRVRFAQSTLKPVIPLNARGVIRERHLNGLPRIIEYWRRKQIVGRQQCWDDGSVCLEYAIRNGKMHGPSRYLARGKLQFETHYVNGKEHGIAKQYDEKGRQFGGYRMNHGTGLDLWYRRDDRGRISLSQSHYKKDEKWHGYDRWWEEGNHVYTENHFCEGKRHGIFREWNHAERLKRGFPKYYVNDQQCDKRSYLKASALDPLLPKLLEADNRPYRKKPPPARKGSRTA